MASGLFKEAQFFKTVNDLKTLPKVSGEVAFVGRSNAGKSSAINVLTGRKRLAFVSKTPGRTRHINYFQLKNGSFLVDLPGYGYAAVSSHMKQHWVKLLGEYLANRQGLLGLVMIMDCRHPLRELDQQMLDFFLPRALPMHILLSKADKLSRNEQKHTYYMTDRTLDHWKKQGVSVSLQLFSSLKYPDIKQVEEVVAPWFDHD